MSGLRDRLNRFSGKTRYVGCRLFLHLAGSQVAPLLGILNEKGRDALDSEGDIQVVGEGLVQICEELLRHQTYWASAANEGDVLWAEDEAAAYVDELFTDSAQRYSSGVELEAVGQTEELTLPPTQNLIVMITVAFTGEEPALESDLASVQAMQAGLKAIVSLQLSDRIKAIQVHFSPSRFGEELESDQLLEFFPELIPL
jgi:uncharacterized membrane protein